MKILFCNTYLYRRGGAEVSFFEVAELLARQGHTVLFFGMKDPRNEVVDDSEYFVDNLEFDDYRPTRLLWGMKAVGRVLHSAHAMDRVRGLLEKRRPDLVYVNNIAHHISPSILEIFRRFGLPIVMSIRDYKIICPNSLLLNRKGICERCKGARYYNVLLHRCKRDSLVPSAIACAEAYLHRAKKVYSLVDLFVTPSQFCKAKLIQFGLDESKISVIPNFVEPNGIDQSGHVSEAFCAYFGRLSREKGLYELIEAISTSGESLVVMGEGALRDRLVDRAEALGARNVKFTGRLGKEELFRTVAHSLFTVFPSLCYETFGRGVLESFALGKPVVASRGGALEELVEDGIDGLLVEPGDSRDLAEKISVMFSSPETAREMGERGRAKALAYYTPERHYRQLMSALESVYGRSSN